MAVSIFSRQLFNLKVHFIFVDDVWSYEKVK